MTTQERIELLESMLCDNAYNLSIWQDEQRLSEIAEPAYSDIEIEKMLSALKQEEKDLLTELQQLKANQS